MGAEVHIRMDVGQNKCDSYGKLKILSRIKTNIKLQKKKKVELFKHLLCDALIFRGFRNPIMLFLKVLTF